MPPVHRFVPDALDGTSITDGDFVRFAVNSENSQPAVKMSERSATETSIDVEFDVVPDRLGTNSPKWDVPTRPGGRSVIALSVADMDFLSPPAVVSAVAQRAAQGVFGYTDLAADHGEIVSDFLHIRHDWKVPVEHIVYCNRVVQALALMLQRWTTPGEKVFLHHPAYSPLSRAVALANRRLVSEPLVEVEGRYAMDLPAMEAHFASGVRTMILTNPHNPTGRVWRKDELVAVADLCDRYDVLIISDDVHADFTRPGHSHTFIGSLDPRTARRTITLTSPGKSFNVPGLEITNVVIPDDDRRVEFQRLLRVAGFHNPSFFASAVTRAAYRESLDWLDRLRSYLEGNFEVLRASLSEQMPGFRLVEPEGTFLAWIDARRWSEDPNALSRLLRRADVAVTGGRSFGSSENCFRLNYATSRGRLREALDRMTRAYQDHK